MKVKKQQKEQMVINMSVHGNEATLLKQIRNLEV